MINGPNTTSPLSSKITNLAPSNTLMIPVESSFVISITDLYVTVWPLLLISLWVVTRTPSLYRSSNTTVERLCKHSLLKLNLTVTVPFASSATNFAFDVTFFPSLSVSGFPLILSIRTASKLYP